MNIFAVTEKLRKELNIAASIAQMARQSSMVQGLKTEDYVSYGKKAEYQRGRADGIRLAIEVISRMLQQEVRFKETVTR